MAHILIVDDEKNYRIVLGQLLEGAGHHVTRADNPYAALDILSGEQIDLIISDLKMPRMSGIDFLRHVNDEIGPVPFIMLTAYATVQTALQAMKIGAFDYLLKPFDNEEMLLTVDKALDYSKLQNENWLLRRELEQNRDRTLVGNSPAMESLRNQIAQVAPAKTSILITGESGTGKELVAQALHRLSPRSNKALVSINCAAFAENLLESELFGHERGAFTGALERKKGLMEVSDGGTLFLDEIGEFPLNLQPKLLRVLQEKTFRRVGGTAEISSDIRIIAATHRNLEQMITEGTFREDLYYRLNVVSLHLPPLRHRREDIPLLSQLFLERLSRDMGCPLPQLSSQAQHDLYHYEWPGNVRELQNILERGLLFCDGPTLEQNHLPQQFHSQAPHHNGCSETAAMPLQQPLPEHLETIEQKLIQAALIDARGVQAKAAELLGISRSNLQYKLKKYHLV
ncbi:sigma-54 dependent transcriptional regulator [Desulfuromonas acetoxidans]|uniref:sigma-54-dependent transcriptional regulator n=1 Tax=Desulfuromonas acetoxidans TaxID=891 RepID=UPI0029302FB6|nr:sigma-54 dependent transcriptional regulator [Desulfuromonas acetoxidans]